MNRPMPVFLAALLLILTSAPAWAKLTDFGIYVADVPPNWKHSFSQGVATLVSPEKDCVMIITDGLSVFAHKKKVADLVKKYDYIIKEKPDQNVTATRIHGIRVVVTILGDHRDRVPIYYSINLKDDDHVIPYR